ncbi:hypothetical protein NW752_008199 [Fusarium irregulare]|nr:hypothetical protein NW752_008199 [Fusarium irregulare]
MAPQSLKCLLTVFLATSSVYAGLCKPSSQISSIFTSASISSGVETWSGTTLSTVETSIAISTTVFEITPTAETTTSTATTTTKPESGGCIPCQEAVLKDDAPLHCGRKVEHWNLPQSAIIDSVSFATFNGRCESHCSNDCRCKAFTKDSNGCVFYSQGEREMQPEDFDMGNRLYDMSCFKCDHMV